MAMVDVTGQPVAGEEDGKGFKAPLQRPDAPQWRGGGIADSAWGRGREGGRGGQIQVRLSQENSVCRRLKSDKCSRAGFMKL